MIDEERPPFVLALFDASARTRMCRPVCVLDGCSLMVIGVMIAIVVVVVGLGEVNVRGREDRCPDGCQHQN